MSFLEPNRTFHVAILYGGDRSAPQESQASAQALASHLARLGHRPTLIDPLQQAPDAIEWGTYQVCHVGIADHGEWHRRLQGQGIVHTGSSAEAVELAASRAGARQYFLQFDVPTPPFVLLRDHVSPLEAVARVASLGYPLLVRADDRRDATTYLARSADELITTVKRVFATAPRVLCERFLPGRAFSVVVQGEQVLPPVETHLPGDGQSPAGEALSPSQRRCLEQVANLASMSLGMSGLVQVEVILDRHDRPWVLEVNPFPDLTEESAAARAARAAGFSLTDLCHWLVQDCLLAEAAR